MIHRLTDKSVIRAYLNTDREWSLYALADLDDGMFEDCDWWSSGDNLALVFRALEIRPILVVGDPRKLLPYLPERSGYLNLKPEQFDGAQDFYAYRERHQMNRMIVDEFTPHAGEAEPLTRHDRKAIEDLYETGDGGGIAFAPFQLDTGFFRGVRHGNELVAVAGVHVVSHNESVAGVGNIFTRPDCRGNGLAKLATSSVVTALSVAGIRTIGLNVEHTNAPAIQVYQRLGFRTRFHYFEGVADRVGAVPQ